MKIKVFLTAFILFFVWSSLEVEAAYPSYTINPNSKTYEGKMMNFSTYNQHTKHYYLIRSYLEQLEKAGGGTLILNKGTYTISNTLYVPSNVEIRLKNEVILNKGTVTGTSQFSAAKSIFQLVRPSRANAKGMYGGYNGEKNISFIGEGKAIIDMKFVQDGIAIIAGHNQNVVIDNIQFQNMFSGHFIEVDATKKIQIKNSKFLNSKASTYQSKEAINLDTPDRLTEGWSQEWSKYDKTPNDNVLIENNMFSNLDTAIGTHSYSEGKLHNNVVIRKNVIDTMRTNGIRAMNWSNAVIENNTIKNLPTGAFRGILASGVKNPTFRHNQFENVPRAIEFLVWKNSGKASAYKVIYNELSNTNKTNLATNSIKNGVEGFIRSNRTYNDFKNGMEFFPLKVVSLQGKPKTLYASSPMAKAYQSYNKNSGHYATYAPGTQLNLYSLLNNWYYGEITHNGKTVRAYFHEDEVQGSKPLVAKQVYISKGDAKAYKSTSKTSGHYTILKAGGAWNMYYIGNNWYYRYVTHNGQSVKAYFHEDNVQGSKPFLPKTLYVSPGGAKAYQSTNKTSTIYQTYPTAATLSIESIGNNWYYGYVTINGQSTKAYFHEDEVQGSKPLVAKQVYISKGDAKAYKSTSKTSGHYTILKAGEAWNMYYIGNNWYYRYVTHNGQSVKAYFHEDNVQGSKPFLPKTIYASPGGAKAYQSTDKTSTIYQTHPTAATLSLEYIGNNWYYGFVTMNGQSTKAYFHEDEVQGSKPNL